MNQILINALLAALAVSLISLIGILTFALKRNLLKKISMVLVAFSTGALLGGAFLHLLPESIPENSNLNPFIFLLAGIVIFYVLERFLKWHHCHGDEECKVHTFTYMSLIGDGVHNFIDGLIIVAAFSVSVEVGVATTIAIASHEIPQELGDFGILIHGGFSKIKALLWNLLSSFSAILGVIIGFILINSIDNISAFLLPFAAGGFVYISMSDLIPELHKENNLRKSLIYFSMFIIGLGFMYLTKIIFE